jgi:tripartite-type tricarboxylate transporter receptor subunit TctC
MTKRAILNVPAVVCAAVFSMSASAQQPYPVKPIRIVEPSPPGAPADVLVRLLGEKLAPVLGQPVVVENRPGAFGTIGINTVAKATADGHTLGRLSMTYLTAPALMAKMPYDTERDLAPVSLIGKDSNLLVVPSGAPARSAAELIKAAKAKPGMLKFASGGNSTPAHLVGELFKREAGVDIVHIPFKGPVAGVTALIGGEIDMMFGATVAVTPHIKSGRLRVLAVSTAQRIPAYPEVPTMAEIGFPRVVFENWFGIVAPAATPKPVIARLHREMQTIGAMQETKQRLDAVGIESVSASPEQFAALVRSDLPRMVKLVRDAGIKPD